MKNLKSVLTPEELKWFGFYTTDYQEWRYTDLIFLTNTNSAVEAIRKFDMDEDLFNSILEEMEPIRFSNAIIYGLLNEEMSADDGIELCKVLVDLFKDERYKHYIELLLDLFDKYAIELNEG